MQPRGPTTIADAGSRSGDADQVLIIVGAGHFSSHVVRADQTLVFGRDKTCDVPLEHPKVSRRHVIVRGGPPMTVEDAGSTNGVRVQGRRLDPGEQVALEPGWSFQFGPFSALLLGMPSPMGSSMEGRATLVVRDPTATTLHDVVQRVAASNVTVLIRGETGVGKDVLARSLHAKSGRTGPFLAVNCAALSESLLESELFGHERGAFTGAVQTKPGLFEAADHGTLFLDEIGELPLGVQAKLLRAVESRQVLRVGGVRAITFDVRFIAATHHDLQLAVARGAFRQDLYFRLNGITLLVPPLRERREAIPRLAQELLAEACNRAGRPRARLAPAAVALLTNHRWPGNVRELRTVIDRALLLAPGDEIGARYIALDAAPASEVAPAAAATPITGDRTTGDRNASEPGAADVGGDEERVRIVAALEQCAGNQTKAAKLLGVSRATLVNKMIVHRIPRPRRG